MRQMNRTFVLLASAAVVSLAIGASRALAEDWPMWGRTPQRHMVSPEKNPPTEWDVESGKNVKWKANVGSKSYGNPVIANGLVFVGTNNEAFYDAKITAPSLESGGTGLLQAIITSAKKTCAAAFTAPRCHHREALATPC